nr:hypothetical protein [Tanacetum cinerariifolium]
MAVGSRDHPLMLATRRYAQWQSQFLKYIDTRPNGDALRKCILGGPYKLTTVTILVVPATVNSLAVLKRKAVETLLNMSPKTKSHYWSEKEAIHLLLTGIRNEIYSTVDACKTTHDISNRYPVDTSLIHIESHKSHSAELFDVDSRRISIHHYTLSSCSNLEDQQMQQIQDKAKRFAWYPFDNFIHTSSVFHKTTYKELEQSGFKRAFTTIFGQDIETFTGTMFLNVEQLEKQLDKEDFQEIGSMAAFNVLEIQF